MLYVECYADEALARTLGVPRRSVRHEGCKGNIVNRLRRLEAGTGLVDEDSAGFQPAEFKNYREVQRTAGLILMAHSDNASKRIVLVRPRLEEWLYARAGAARLNPGDFGLPSDPDHLHSIPRYDQKPKFLEFLKRLKELDAEVQRLSEWISK